MKTGKEIQEQINKLSAELWAVENNIINSSAEVLVEEILNLFANCGKGYTKGDYYAQTRYYSNIPGVKNIRQGSDDENGNCTIVCKIGSPIGGLLPDEIKISGKTYSIKTIISSKYSEEMNY